MPLQVWRFGEPRPVSAPEFRRLAPATEAASTSILVEYDQKEARTVGLVHTGSAWEISRRGFDYKMDPPPDALNVAVEAPGCLSVFQGGYMFARLAEGRLSRQTAIPSTEFPWFSANMRNGLASLTKQAPLPEYEPERERHEFEYHAYLNVFVAIANSIELAHHGGTLLIINDENSIKEHIRSKYPINSNELAEQFMGFLDKRHRFADGWHRMEAQGQGEEGDPTQYLAYREAVLSLARTASFVGRLAAVDGAVVITSDLRLVGFGTEIRLQNLPDVIAWELKEPMDLHRKKAKRLNSEQYGMRHRSAMRLCGNLEGVAALVVSQDGGVNAVFSHQQKLYFRRRINAANTVMLLT
jgi:DNA integrity scanning protein DisA with diadenylate cyclase activity